MPTVETDHNVAFVPFLAGEDVDSLDAIYRGEETEELNGESQVSSLPLILIFLSCWP